MESAGVRGQGSGQLVWIGWDVLLGLDRSKEEGMWEGLGRIGGGVMQIARFGTCLAHHKVCCAQLKVCTAGSAALTQTCA